MNTTESLFRYVMDNSDSSDMVQLPVRTLAMLAWFAESVGVQDVCTRHNSIMADMRKRADGCRYRNMAHAVIGDKKADMIYHPAHSGTVDFGDWETDVKLLNEPREPDI